MSAFLAVDWGTTNRRVYRIEHGAVTAVTATERDTRGVAAMNGEGYEAEIAGIRARFGDLPLLMAGMVGSTIGWREAAYVPIPAGLDALAAGLLRIDARTAIVPGLRTDGDVMRGEEVQLLGAAASGLAPADARLCQPGTHCKWATVRGGEVVDFTTAMTGELFALLCAHSVLAKQLAGEVVDSAAFREGVAEGARRDLGASLFGIRAASVLGARGDGDAASYASGVLIGADVAVRIDAGERVHVLADPELGGLYLGAIDALGGEGILVDSHAAFVAGIVAIEGRSR